MNFQVRDYTFQISKGEINEKGQPTFDVNVSLDGQPVDATGKIVVTSFKNVTRRIIMKWADAPAGMLYGKELIVYKDIQNTINEYISSEIAGATIEKSADQIAYESLSVKQQSYLRGFVMRYQLETGAIALAKHIDLCLQMERKDINPETFENKTGIVLSELDIRAQYMDWD